MPSLPRITPGPRGFGRRADASDFGGAEAAAQAERGQAIGQVGGALAEIVQAERRIYVGEQRAALALAVARRDAERDEFIFSLESDPDLDTHQERLEKFEREGLERTRKELPSEFHGELEDRLFESRARGELRVRANVRGKRIESGRAKYSALVETSADHAGRTLDPESRSQIRAGVIASLDEGVDSGLLTPAMRDAALKELDAKTTEALLRAGKNQDPAGALADLKARRNGFEHMSEVARQQGIEALEDEIKQRERLAKIEDAESRARARESKQEAEDATAQEGMALALDGKLTTDWLRKNLPALSKSDARYFESAISQQKTERGIPDPAEWARLNDLQFNDPEAFAAETIDASKVGATEWQKMKTAQAKARKGEASSPSEVRTVARQRAELAQGLDDAQRGELQRSYEAALEDFEATQKKPATSKEREAVMDAVELQRYRAARTPLFWVNTPAQLAPDGTPIQIPGFDEADVGEAIQRLTLAGKRVAPESIQAELLKMASEVAP